MFSKKQITEASFQTISRKNKILTERNYKTLAGYSATIHNEMLFLH